MMTIFIIFIIVSIGAIILLSRTSFVASKTKDEFSKELTRQVKGNIENLEGQPNSYRLTFNFEGRDFIFEDVELKGFKEKVEKAYLKLKLKNRYTLIFSEIDRSGGIRMEAMQAQVKESSLTTMMKVYLPKNFSDMTVKTNDPYLSNKIFDDTKILPIFTEFRNVDARGKASMSLSIVDGLITLEFSSLPGYSPSLQGLRTNLGLIENYMDKLIAIAQKLEKLGYY